MMQAFVGMDGDARRISVMADFIQAAHALNSVAKTPASLTRGAALLRRADDYAVIPMTTFDLFSPLYPRLFSRHLPGMCSMASTLLPPSRSHQFYNAGAVTGGID